MTFLTTSRVNQNFFDFSIQRIFFVVCISFLPFAVFSQELNIDSMEQILISEIDIETRVHTLLNISEVYEYTNPTKGKEYIDKALELARGNEALEIAGYRKLAPSLSKNNQLDSTISIVNTLLSYYQINTDNDGLVFCYTLMGLVMKKKYEFEASADFYKKGLVLSKAGTLDKATLHLNLSLIQENLGYQQAALESCFKTLSIAEKLNNYKLLGKTKDRIGSLYYVQNDYERAIEYYREAIELFKKGGVDLGVAISNINMANTYFLLDNNEEALRIYEEVLAFSEKINYPPYILYSKCYLAFFYAEANSDKCEPLLTELDTMVSQMDAAGLMQYYSAKIYYYQNQKKYQSAIEMADSLRAFSIICKDIDKHIGSLRFLADLSQKIGDYKQIYDYLIEYKVLSDSVTNEQRITELKLKEAQYNFDKEQLALEQAYQLEAAAQKRLNILMLLFAIILGTISFFLFRIAQSRKRLSNELYGKNRELEVLNESKTRFFANVSHELKTPLTLIINPLDKIKRRETINKDDLYLIETAEKNSLELLDLTNQILELNKQEVDKVEVNYSSINLYSFLKKTFANFESLAKSRAIDFQLDFKGNKNLSIQIDEYKLQTILKNLISNALKFTVPGDFVKINVVEKENTLEMQVQDSGRGIQSEDLPHVFDRYFQSKTPKAVSEGGTGIGLAICKEYSKLLGGSISVESKYGESTVFDVSLPKIAAESPIPVSETIVRRAIEHDKSILPKVNNELPTLLLVEDNLEMQDYIQFSLQAYYNIIIAGNGQEGIKKLEAYPNQIQLIISDIMMPVMDGYEFLESIKKDEKLATIPIIMLTALSDTKHKLKGLRIGIDDYLTKPFVEEELIARIDNLLLNVNEKQAFQLIEIDRFVETTDKDVSKEKLTEQTAEKISIQDLEWLKDLEEKIKENLSDTTYTIDKLATQMIMSRSLLYRKIKTLTGLTPNNYINQTRYEQARYYLETKQFSSIKVIAHEVGFKDEKYFSRSFKKRFGKYPSKYME